MKTLYPTLCTAALLMLAACTQDPVEDLVSSGNTQSGDLPEGTFIVDYLPSADLPATRGLGEGEAILSLDYLLYTSKDGSDGSYTLTKCTPIPDIETSTPWPLTRENMTWAQRTALKDTLSTESKYKVVFVANANQEVWKEKEGFQPMTDVDVDTKTTFDQARLVLPPNGDFQQTDDSYTFYYMWTGEIDPIMNKYDKNTPAQMDVVLQRMVNKVEVKLADEVVQGIAESGSVDAYVTDELGKYFDEHYIVTDFTESNRGILDSVVIKYMTDKAEFDISNTVDGIIRAGKKDCQEHFRDILKNITNIRKVTNSISKCENTDINSDKSCCVKHCFIAEAKQDIQLTRICDWSQVTKIGINYETSTYPYAIDFNKKTIGTTDASQNLQLIATIKNNGTSNIDNRYFFYTFGNEENATINVIKSLTLYYNDEQSLEIICGVQPGGQIFGGNRYFELICNPITTITASSTSFQYTKSGYNLENTISLNYDNFPYSNIANHWTQDEVKSWVNSLFSGNVASYTLQLTIPEVRITSPWTTKEH